MSHAQQHQTTPTIGAFDIPAFCDAFHISRAHLYKMMSEGCGPKTMKLGRRTLITNSSAAEWQQRMESAAA